MKPKRKTAKPKPAPVESNRLPTDPLPNPFLNQTRYEGTCIGGPLDGQQLVYDRSTHVVYGFPEDDGVSIVIGEYRHSQASFQWHWRSRAEAELLMRRRRR